MHGLYSLCLLENYIEAASESITEKLKHRLKSKDADLNPRVNIPRDSAQVLGVGVMNMFLEIFGWDLLGSV